MAETEEKQSGWRWGFNRWIVLLLIIAGFWLNGIFKPISPHIVLAAENVAGPYFQFLGQDFYLTNTLIGTIIADIIVLLIGFGIWRASRSGSLIPKGFSGGVEFILEALYNLTEGTAGKWTKTIFPFFATIFLLVISANWIELFPSVESVGVFDEHHIKHPEECTFVEKHFLGLELQFLTAGDAECSSGIIPFLRVASTDLNFTAAIALFSVISIQIVGVRALGLSYFTKFFNTSTLFKVPMFGVIDFGVSLIELVSEFIKILSFAFRLFGNIFAGSVMLFVIGSLAPVAQTGILMLEFFVGAVQAFVFGMLVMIFMAQATISHAHEDH